MTLFVEQARAANLQFALSGPRPNFKAWPMPNGSTASNSITTICVLSWNGLYQQDRRIWPCACSGFGAATGRRVCAGSNAS